VLLYLTFLEINFLLEYLHFYIINKIIKPNPKSQKSGDE
jgi:hypothetical protein